MMKLVALFSLLFCSWAEAAAPMRIQLWHSMLYSHREILAELAHQFEAQHPNARIDLTFRETEELRSSYQAAALGGSGPEIVYGPADQVGPFAIMKLIRPLEELFTPDELNDLDPMAKVQLDQKLYALGDSVGNHLMLIYNRRLLAQPPGTVSELERLAAANTIDENHDGRMERYGLVFNFTEPFFFVPWIKAFGESFFVAGWPHLNTDSTRHAFGLMRRWRDELKIIPRECDYEMANALFKEGRAAMIINGDWSWGDYKKAGIDFGVAPLPKVDSTGLWPAPLVGTKGYSINARIQQPEVLEMSVALVRFLLRPEAQIYFARRAGILPSSHEAQRAVSGDPGSFLSQSQEIMAHGEPMPVAPEIRAVWDGLRGPYQQVLAGVMSPEQASAAAQVAAERQIQAMNEVSQPTWQTSLVYLGAAIILALLILYFIREWRKAATFNRREQNFAYLMVLPAFIGILIVIVFPFLYTLSISVSNLSLRTFSSWAIVGFTNYGEVLFTPDFYVVFFKTVVWTAVNVAFHVGLGVMLAVLIEQTLPAKGVWRTLLIIPWTIPQYITALTWRGMFHQEYGPINIFLASYLHLSPVQWLSQPLTTFAACAVTNIWLGFPFMMVVALGGLQAIPHELYEAARLDGANTWHRFKSVTWPMLMPVMWPAILLGTIWTFNNLNVVWLVSNGGEPADQTQILVSYVYKAAFGLYRYAHAAALSMMIFVILLLLTMWMSWLGKRREAQS